MTFNRMLAATSAALGALLVYQVAAVATQDTQPPQRRLHASWIDKADTIEEGLDKSHHVVLGEVTRMRRGPDIVLPAPGEPSGEDRIPTMIVSLKVQKTYKGPIERNKVVELIQTGHSADAELLPEDPFPAAPAAKGDRRENDKGKGKGKGKRSEKGLSKNSPVTPTAGDSRATILEDDPPYLIGEKYVLFLKDMQNSPTSAMARAGVGPAMKRVLAPEGRLQLTKGDRLKPATHHRGFAPNLIGKPLTEFETTTPPLR
jgi:hypothetical protein